MLVASKYFYHLYLYLFLLFLTLLFYYLVLSGDLWFSFTFSGLCYSFIINSKTINTLCEIGCDDGEIIIHADVLFIYADVLLSVSTVYRTPILLKLTAQFSVRFFGIFGVTFPVSLASSRYPN